MVSYSYHGQSLPRVHSLQVLNELFWKDLTAFIDVLKVFNTVNREFLWNISLRFGCPRSFVSILLQFYVGVTAGVSPIGYVRVCQRCILVPLLYNLQVAVL